MAFSPSTSGQAQPEEGECKIVSDQFTVAGPTWIVFDRSKKKDQGTGDEIVHVTTPKGTAIVVFTDEDLARTFVEKSGNPNWEPARFDGTHNFASFLRRMQQ